MPDFLDALIGQIRNTSPVIRPRTPSLFEPTSTRVGPDERFEARRSFSPDSPQIPVSEPPAPALAEPTLPTPGISSPAIPAQNRPASPGPQPAEEPAPARSTAAPPEAPPSPASLPKRLNNLDSQLSEVRAARPQPKARPAAVERIAQSLPQPGDEVTPLRPEVQPAMQQETISPSRYPPVQNGDAALDRAPANPAARPALSTENDRLANRLQRLTSDLEWLRQQIGSESAARSALAPAHAADRFTALAATSPRNEAPLLIQVSIGRVEVRAAPAPAPTPARPSAARGSAPTSLEDYLRRTNGGSR